MARAQLQYGRVASAGCEASLAFAGMEMWELIAREEIRDTLVRYNHGGDRGKFDEMIECFAPDGVLVIVDGATHRGRDALRDFFAGVGGAVNPALTQMRHSVTNVVIDLESDTSARASSYFHVITDIGLDHWGRYRDRLARFDDGWRLTERSVKTDGYATDSLFR